MPLSPDQKAFCARYIDHGGAANAAGPQPGAADAEAVDTAALAQPLLEALDDIARNLDPDITAPERDAFGASLDTVRNILQGVPTEADIARAEKAVPLLRAKAQAIADSNREAQEARNFYADQQRAKAEEAFATLREDAEPADREALAQHLEALQTRAASPVSPEAIEDLTTGLAALTAQVAQTNAALIAAQIERDAAARKHLDTATAAAQTLDEDADATQSGEIDTALQAITQSATTPIDAATLERLEEQVTALQQQLQTLNAALEAARQAREAEAGEIQATAEKLSGARDADASDDMNTDLDDQVAAIKTILTPRVKELALENGREKLATLEARVAEIATQMTGFREVRDNALVKLGRLRADSDGMKPHDRAPDRKKDPILSAAAKLLTDSAAYTDLAQIVENGLGMASLEALETDIAAIELDMEQLNSGIQEQLDAVAVAVLTVTGIIDSPKGRALSDAQRKVFTDQVESETDKTDADLDAADSVIAALKDKGAEINRLSLSLAAYERRIKGVSTPDPLKLSGKERTLLETAEKAARDALDAVVTL